MDIFALLMKKKTVYEGLLKGIAYTNLFLNYIIVSMTYAQRRTLSCGCVRLGYGITGLHSITEEHCQKHKRLFLLIIPNGVKPSERDRIVGTFNTYSSAQQAGDALEAERYHIRSIPIEKFLTDSQQWCCQTC